MGFKLLNLSILFIVGGYFSPYLAVTLVINYSKGLGVGLISVFALLSLIFVVFLKKHKHNVNED